MRYFIFILSLFFLAGCISIGENDDPALAQLNTLEKKGDKAFRKDNYIKAVQCYIDAVIEAEEIAPERLDKISQKLGATYLDWARTLYWKAKQDRSEKLCLKAITMAQRASEIDSRRAVQCKVLLKKLTKDLASIKYENVTDINKIDPVYEERRLQIDVFCKQAAVFYASRQYMRARDKYEEVLLVDPFNLTAIRGLKKVMREVSRVGSERRKITEQERMAEVEWNYVQTIAMKEKQAQKSQSDQSLPESLEDKLADFIIKELNFKDTPLNKVFSVLQTEISVFLKGDFTFKYEGFSPRDKNIPPLTFDVKNIPASDAIKVICEGMKLTYKFNKDSITISPQKTK